MVTPLCDLHAFLPFMLCIIADFSISLQLFLILVEKYKEVRCSSRPLHDIVFKQVIFFTISFSSWKDGKTYELKRPYDGNVVLFE